MIKDFEEHSRLGYTCVKEDCRDNVDRLLNISFYGAGCGCYLVVFLTRQTDRDRQADRRTNKGREKSLSTPVQQLGEKESGGGR